MISEQARFGHYMLFERISRGGMAEVYRAKTTGAEGFEKLVAVKRILPSIAEDEEFVKMFVDEAKLTVQLTHPNIAQVLELGKLEGTFFIAMEYVPGKDLRSIFNRLAQKNLVAPMPLTCALVAQVADGLDYAHKKRDPAGRPIHLVHRDVSPANVLLSYEGEVRLIDFGIARAETRSTHTRAGTVKGKFAYMSPEQARGKELDHRSDQFSLGVLLWELLAGARLFVSDTDMGTIEKVRKAEVPPLAPLNKSIPPALEAIVRKALALEAKDRFPSTAELSEALNGFLVKSGMRISRNDVAKFMGLLFPAEREAERKLIARMLSSSGPHESPAEPRKAEEPAAAASEFQVRRSSGETFPCGKLTTLQKWIIEGRVSRDDEFGKGGAWKRLGDIPDLVTLFDVYEAAYTPPVALTPSRPVDPIALTPSRPAPPAGPMEGVHPQAKVYEESPPDIEQAISHTQPFQVRAGPRPILRPLAPAPRKSGAGKWVVALVVLLALGLGGFYALLPREFRRVFRLAPRDVPAFAKSHFQSGRELYLKGSHPDLVAARADFEKAMEFAAPEPYPRAMAALIDTHVALGDRAREKGDLAAAKRSHELAFELVREADPLAEGSLEVTRAQANYYRAVGGAAMGQLLEKLRATAPRDPEVRALIALTQLADETQRDAAQKNLAEALEGLPDLNHARVALAGVLEMNKAPDRALVQLKEVLRRAPGHERAQAMLARIEAALAPPPEPAVADAASVADGDAASVVSAEPEPAISSPQPVDAASEPVLAALAVPAPPPAPRLEGYDAFLARAEQLRKREKTRDALDLYGKAHDLQPQRVEPLVGKGLCLLDLSRYNAAQASFQQALAIEPANASAWMGMAETASYLGKTKEAAAWYRKYLDAYPGGSDAPAAKNALAKIKD